MADSKLPALTEVSVPALDDPLYLVDVSDTTDDATGSSRKASITRLLGLLNHVCQGRLTLESGVAVSTSDQTAKTSVYFTPYNGNRIAIYDGTRWRLYAFSELTLALGTLTSGKNYDIFIYDNAGTLTLELSAAWSSDTARTDALTTQDGVYVKSGATTRRYLGTIRTTSTTTTEDSGSPASGTTPKRFLWNMYNRVQRHLRAIETANFWTYGTNTFQSANADDTNRLEFVVGMASVMATATITSQWAGAGTAEGAIAIGLDSTSAASADCDYNEGYNANASVIVSASTAFYRGQPGLGYHYLQWIEKSISGTSTFYGDNSGNIRSGITGAIEG